MSCFSGLVGVDATSPANTDRARLMVLSRMVVELKLYRCG